MKAEWTNSDSLTTSQTTKAILVFDKMPNSCGECEVRCTGYTAKDYAQKDIKRPSWCPLKPMPKLKEPRGFIVSARKITEIYDNKEDVGYNKCLYEIMGEDNG